MKDTEPELVFRRAIWKRGLRYRVCDRRFAGKPDLVFPAHKLMVFIDGDFWHGHQWKLRRLSSIEEQFSGATNRSYWLTKIRRNVERDFRSTASNLEIGWSVLRFWESELNRQLENCVDMTIAAIQEGHRRTPEAVLPTRTVAEFFAGIGLVRLALDRRGWSVTFGNDNDPQKGSMYRDNFSDEHLSTADIRDLSAADVPNCTLFTASFPCNDLSVAGAMAGLNGNQSGMFWQFIRILKEKGKNKPPLILLENVVGFLMSNGGRDFETALLALNELGYCVDAIVLNASSFTPQSRARLFVIAKRSAPHTLDTATISSLRPAALVQFIAAHPNVIWDIRPLPSPPAKSQRLQDIVENLKPNDPHWWNEKRTEYFMGQLSERHMADAEKMIAGSKYTYATAFRRVRKGRSMAELRTDGIAGCLRTPRGGSGRQILFKAGRGKYRVRLLTARECARLQGVPDSYKIEVPLNQALFGFGDAVCVPVIEWIIDNYLTPVASELMRGRLLRNGSGRRK